MFTKPLFFSLLLFAVFLLSACGKPQTPVEVSEAFWQGVINNRVSDVVEYSTLGSEVGYEAFSRDWEGMLPSWGKMIIEEHEARIHTQISRPDAAQSEMLFFVTYLTRQESLWKVDYDKTENALLASTAVSDFVKRISSIGDEITQQFEEASNTVTAELENLNSQLLQLSQNLGEQANSAVERYSEVMRQHLDALARSIEQAIQEQNTRINADDRKILEETVTGLEKSSKKLARPGVNSIAETGEVIIITRKNLETIDSGTFQEYETQWQQWIKEVNDDLGRLLNEMTIESK